MSNAKDSPNIVDLTKRQEPRSERGGDLLGAVRRIAAERLQALAGSMFDNVDDALFDLAEKAENNAVQTQFFDGMREVRKKRALIERLFLEQTARDLSDFAAGRAQPATAENPAPHRTDELSLVEETDLEESLAITSMVGKTESRLARQLFAVNQRLSVICGGSKMDNASNPIGPSMLGQGFRRAANELNVELRVRLIVYKLFDRYVMAGLDALYAQINNELMRAGVLPQLRHSVPGRHPLGAGPTAAGEAARHAAGAHDDEAAVANDRASIRHEVLRTLHGLLQARRAPGPDAGHGGAAASGRASTYQEASLSPAELLGALSLLQSETMHQDDPAHGEDGVQLDAEQVKQQLMAQISRLRGNRTSRMAGADEDTIDLVAMLFEFILQDRNLPAEMQALLARLQIPYLKAAILDRSMFENPQHPTRRLLDGLADVAKSWSPEADRDRRTYDKVHGIVSALLQNFDDDMDIFNRLDRELQDFVDSNTRRAQLAEQRVAEATRGREKLQEARRRAAREILSRLEHRELPQLAHGILTRAWANYLVLTLLRHGEDSTEFRMALRFIDDFIWSAQPRHSDAERDRLRQLLPLLEKSLRHGLATVAFQDADVENLIGQLHTFYSRQLGETPRADTADSSTDASAPMPIPESVEAIAVPEQVEEQAPAEGSVAVDKRFIDQVRALKVGTWMEFTHEGQPETGNQRAKLSWISPISGKYLFVNRRGLKVGDKTLHQLASELASGATVVLEELPLFDRALDAIVERLRKTQAGGPGDATASAATDGP